MHEGRELLGLGEVVEVVGIFTQVDEVDRRIFGIRPGDDEHGVVVGAFSGPFGEHL